MNPNDLYFLVFFYSFKNKLRVVQSRIELVIVLPHQLIFLVLDMSISLNKAIKVVDSWAKVTHMVHI
jgi:hypothetical protein